MSLESKIKAEAHRLGFELVGITTPDPPPHFEIFREWIEAGHHGEMAYLGSERSLLRRSDPRQILPECRSILVLGTRYATDLTPEAAGPSRGGTGRVASYAWGTDYHDVLPERLKALVQWIEQETGRPVPNRWYTDTGPILERDLAQRAGLGWIGKNGCLIHPQEGSYFLLAEILLGLALLPDPPFASDHCGSCTRCIDACPTACILPNRTLDAQRCLSYLTIELKDAIPIDLRSHTGSWVFGCDICQQVCPWNIRFAHPEGDAALAPLPGVSQPVLITELGLSPEAFNAKFKGSPVKRTKRRGYLRNVAVALGNTKDPAAAPALEEVLWNDTEPLVRAHAAWALGEIGGDRARQALETSLAQEEEASVIAEIQRALSLLR